MAASTLPIRPRPTAGRPIASWTAAALVLAATLALGSWRQGPARPAAVPVPPTATAPPTGPVGPPAWPAGRMEGEPAKRVLLAALREADAHLDRAAGYTAILTRRERIRGALGPEQTIALKIQHEPFGVYMRFLAPKAGKEAVYLEGAHDNKLVAHNGDWTRRLIPRLTVDPTDPIALRDNRHPITDAGLANLVGKLVRYREHDLVDPHAVTVLDRVVDAAGRPWLYSLHTHPTRVPERPFARVEVWYHPDTFVPHRIASYEWPDPGHEGDLLLAETYRYDDVNLDADLTALDFDPANPDYAFRRY